MPRQLQPATESDVGRVRLALEYLRGARDCLAQAKAPQALARVQAAIKSTDGALRHVQGRALRTSRES